MISGEAGGPLSSPRPPFDFPPPPLLEKPHPSFKALLEPSSPSSWSTQLSGDPVDSQYISLSVLYLQDLTWLPPDRQKLPCRMPAPAPGQPNVGGMQVKRYRIPGEEGWTSSSQNTTFQFQSNSPASPPPHPSPLSKKMTGPFTATKITAPLPLTRHCSHPQPVLYLIALFPPPEKACFHFS